MVFTSFPEKANTYPCIVYFFVLVYFSMFMEFPSMYKKSSRQRRELILNLFADGHSYLLRAAFLEPCKSSVYIRQQPHGGMSHTNQIQQALNATSAAQHVPPQ
jgi:hypothetical protein